ncbi:MAG: rubrerythrin family protein [Romboutsia sp.]|nr:rubrerythrin family protein [Romboutsia sp.]
MDLRQDSKTFNNLEIAYQGEAGARTKYLYYASQAKKEGYNKIAQVFEETAHNENAHAKIWFKLLHGRIPDTRANLMDAINGEDFEYEDMYETFSKEAEEEGYYEIAQLFREVGKIEKEHSNRFRELLSKMDNFYEKDNIVTWRCMNCGHEHKSTDAPEMCPVCNHPRPYFEVKNDIF